MRGYAATTTVGAPIANNPMTTAAAHMIGPFVVKSSNAHGAMASIPVR